MVVVTAKAIPAPRADVKTWQLMEDSAVLIRRRLMEAVHHLVRRTARLVLFQAAVNLPVEEVPIVIPISASTVGARTMAWMTATVLPMLRRAILLSVILETAPPEIKRLGALVAVPPLQSNV